jgi:fatty-acyl-CoA synthase
MSHGNIGLATRASDRPHATHAWLRALEQTASITAQPTRTLPVVIAELAQTCGDAPALLSECDCWSYRQLAERMNQYARWALAQRIAPGDVVCLLMPSRPEYLAIWLGISAVGGVVSLLNSHLSGRSLAHCIDVVTPKHIIVAAELAAAFAAAADEIKAKPVVWSHGAAVDARFAPIDDALKACSGAPLEPSERPTVTIEDRALYMYTSGTTGWPKAAIIDHRRLLTWSRWFAGMMDTGPRDRMYNCLPLYHSIGGVVATGAVLVNGGSVVIREKFSARQFWDDIARWDCTLFQYIGELCRYLTNAAPHPRESTHGIRLCCGNGLRADVWQAFQARFRIPQILEFYAATEGNISFFNVEGKPGAIGRIPSFLAHRFPAALVKVEIDSEQPLRAADGHCVRCAVNEAGLAIGRISTAGEARGGAGSPGARFDGYTSRTETEKKILRNVFEDGDAWFSTGDLMRKDEQGYFYFIDRLGDTFRWKGENVATSEVAEAITAFAAVTEANVYGVAIPGTDGRACMATLVLRGEFDLAAFRSHLAERLPAYARPLVLRIRPAIDVTATFKHTKAGLASEGYDPARVPDPLYFDHPQRHEYVALDQALFEQIQHGALRF